MVAEAPFGPPSVTTWTWPRACNAVSVVVTTTKNTLGEIIGSTTPTKPRQPVAPSRRAASSTSSSMSDRAAASTSRLKPETIQRVTHAVVSTAQPGLVVQPGVAIPSPSSTQSIGDIDGSSISSHTTPAALAEYANGRENSVRNTRIPGRRWDSGTASAIAITSPPTTTTSVKRKVCQSRRPNAGLNRSAKFARPTDRVGFDDVGGAGREVDRLEQREDHEDPEPGEGGREEREAQDRVARSLRATADGRPVVDVRRRDEGVAHRAGASAWVPDDHASCRPGDARWSRSGG